MKLSGCTLLNADFKLEKKDLYIENGKIAFSGTDGDVLDLSGMTVIPGLIDMHLHGYAGKSMATDDRAELERLCQSMLRTGTTSFLPCIGGQTRERLAQVIPCLRSVIEGGVQDGADILGIYFEGPFLSPNKRGAFSASIVRPFNKEEFDEYLSLAGGHVRVVLFAPDVKENLEGIRYAVSRGVTATIGHTTATADRTDEAIRAGATHATHLFNAMQGISHREPGTVGSILDSNVTAELICDGHHVNERVIRTAFKVLGPERTVLISDMVTQSGLPDGTYGSVIIKDGTSRLADGTLCGNVSPLFTLLKRAVSFGIPFPDAVRAATLNPAKLAKADDRKGSIAEGKDADLLVLDGEMNLRYVIKAGKIITP